MEVDSDTNVDEAEHSTQNVVHDVIPSRKGPRDRRSGSNFIFRLLLIWLDSLFCTGCTRDLQESDLTVCPSEAESEKLHRKFMKYWEYELERHKSGKKPRLLVALIKLSPRRMVVQGIAAFIEVVFLFCQPILIGYLTDYFAQLGTLQLTEQNPNITECSLESDTQIIRTRDAYLLAMGMTLASLVISFTHAHGFLFGQKLGMLWRIATTTAIHKKILSLSQATIGKISAGHVINLSSNDVHRFDLALLFIHHLWLAPLQLAAFTYLVYVEFGWSTFIGVAFMIILLFVQFFTARLFAWWRFKAARITDKRVRIMNEVIVGIRVIKMYAWEYAFKRVVKALRKSEVYQVFKGGVMQALSSSFIIGGSRVVIIFLIILPFTYVEGSFSPGTIITTLSLINVVRVNLLIFVVVSFFKLYEAHVAIVRIQNFLLLDELSPLSHDGGVEKAADSSRANGYRRDSKVKMLTSGESSVAPSPQTTVHLTSPGRKVGVDVSGLSVSWSFERDKQVLTDISFQLDKAQASSENPLMAVAGPVGAGKSTLLQCLLGELQGIEGRATVSGTLSYTSQEPWIFSGTIRENILFGSPYLPDRYEQVINACTLDKDVQLFIDGDQTLVGERGVTLSGGQKARVSLARAVYHQADIYLLDDPLSAVDAAVAKHIFENCIQKLLMGKLVVLVTHQIQFALEADKLLLLKDGRMELYGSKHELAERGVDPATLLGLIHEGEEKETFECREEKESLSTPVEQFQTSFNSPLRSNLPSVSTSKCNQKVQRPLDSEELFKGSPFDEATLHGFPSMISLYSAVETAISRHEKVGPPSEERAHGTVSMKTYAKYFRAGGNCPFLSIFFVILFLAEGSLVVTDWWLTDWANCNLLKENRTDECEVRDNTSTLSAICQLTNNDRLWIFTVLLVSSVTLYLVRAVFIYGLAINASRVLHNRMFGSVLRAPTRFFDTNPSGRVLNRFSKDVGFLDDLLPQVLLEVFQLFVTFLASLVTATVGNPWLAIPAAVVIAVFVFFRWYYLKTAREVKRLEAIARSPIYSHISTTLQGLPIIRTFQKQDIAQRLLYHHQDVHSEGWYTYLAITRWFGMRIDLVSVGFLTIIVFASVPLASQLNAELIGLSLVYAVSLAGNFQYCIRQSAELENIMISTERILGYSNLQPEASLETLIPSNKPPPDWPREGRITMDDVAFQYSSELPLVLKNLNFIIKPGEKVGVVGRTGAGKSSLLSVLYRLAEPSGLITIDGVDIQSIGLHDLRRKMSIIPQDPVLFSGTMRYNLDPFSEFSDSDLWDALEQVQLKGAVEQLEGQLTGEVSEGGSNFSVGQKQLVCLARALLRKNRILILDEATANVDVRTDEIIQQAIREKFVHCTVITIAHRLNTIMDSDRILVLDSGEVKEFDTPYNLLQNHNSLLAEMVRKTGPETSRKLQHIAATKHNSVIKSIPVD